MRQGRQANDSQGGSDMSSAQLYDTIGRTPSNGQWAASVMTLPQAGGPNATATLPLSTRQSLAFASLSPDSA